jgi:ParB-like chromosome segregation protein Spo0J
MSEQFQLILRPIENLQREALNPVERFRTLKWLLYEFDLTLRDLARRLGISVAAFTRRYESRATGGTGTGADFGWLASKDGTEQRVLRQIINDLRSKNHPG